MGLLKGLAHAEARLKLFEADIYNPTEFAAAIGECTFVFHLATPMLHYAKSPQVPNCFHKITHFFDANLTYIIISICMFSSVLVQEY